MRDRVRTRLVVVTLLASLMLLLLGCWEGRYLEVEKQDYDEGHYWTVGGTGVIQGIGKPEPNTTRLVVRFFAWKRDKKSINSALKELGLFSFCEKGLISYRLVIYFDIKNEDLIFTPVEMDLVRVWVSGNAERAAFDLTAGGTTSQWKEESGPKETENAPDKTEGVGKPPSGQ